MTDANSAVEADGLRTLADEEYKQFKATNPQETWEDFRRKQTEEVAQNVSQLSFSNKARTRQQVRSQSYSEISTARALTDSTLQLREDTIETLTENLTDAFRSGDPEKIADAKQLYKDSGNNMGKDENEVSSDIKAAEVAGEKLRVQDIVNDVHAAIESAEETGNFELAKQLAQNPVIPEKQQTSLRGTIKTAENTRNTKIDRERQELINTTTSDTLREYFQGTLSVSVLDQRQSLGLIKDTEFKFMRKGLEEKIPTHSDPVAAGNIRRNKTNFHMEAIDRDEANKVAAENYSKLDGADRENVFSDLEDIEEKIIASSKSNAYGNGIVLMSERFVGVKDEDALLQMLLSGKGITEEDKKRINRQFAAEVANRDLYERAVDERFKEMRKAGISESSKFKAEALDILLTYQQRKLLELKELELRVATEQRRIIQGISAEPQTVVRDVKDLTEAEKQTELERIRELRKLAK